MFFVQFGSGNNKQFSQVSEEKYLRAYERKLNTPEAFWCHKIEKQEEWKLKSFQQNNIFQKAEKKISFQDDGNCFR